MTTIHLTYTAYNSETHCGRRGPSLYMVGKAEAEQVTCRGACGQYATKLIQKDRRPHATQAQKSPTPTEALILDFLEDWGGQLDAAGFAMTLHGGALATDDEATTFSDLVGALCEERRAAR
jgi:hypothetical protein|tara:strand:- start:755 stop:1117 length:363 start_codon:yes stop_codon:yes gene_type:complete